MGDIYGRYVWEIYMGDTYGIKQVGDDTATFPCSYTNN